MSPNNLDMSPWHLNMSLRHFAWTKSKMPQRQGNILTFLIDILPEKKTKMSPRHLNMSLWKQSWGVCIRNLNMPLRHLAWKNAKIFPRHLAGQKSQDVSQASWHVFPRPWLKIMPRYFPDILTCFSDILPEKMPKCISDNVTCLPDILTCLGNILFFKYFSVHSTTYF